MTRRARRGWTREGDGLDARYHHIESGWVIVHCGHPTANYPYYGLSPDHGEAFTSGGFGKGYAFRRIKEAQESIELYLHNNQQKRTTTMGWQEEIKGKTIEAAIKEIIGLVKGKLVDNETYEDVDNPWEDRDTANGVVCIHRVWVCKKQEDGSLETYCADLHEYDDPNEPFFVNRVMSLGEGPWGWQPPEKFGHRKGGDKPRAPSEKYTRGSEPSKQFVRELQAADADLEKRAKKEAAKTKAALAKKSVATRKKTGGKYLDKKQHKLVAGHEAACGKPIGEMDAGVWSGGVRGRDSWHFVDCKECLAVKPKTIHKVDFGTGRFGCMERYDDTDGKRWKAKTKCGGFASSTASTTEQHGGVNCMRCLAEVSPHYREHHVGPSGKQTSTLCGAKTNSMVPYATDCWWLVSCPDCYRISEATVVHPMQEEDVQLLLHNSMVAARNQEMKPTQSKCVSCSADSMAAKTKCLACAVLTKRGINTDDDWEDKLAKLFNLPYEWVMDLLKGWDGDKAPELTYPTAFKLGKKLWRKHGG
jgi:hypothetical protein